MICSIERLRESRFSAKLCWILSIKHMKQNSSLFLMGSAIVTFGSNALDALSYHPLSVAKQIFIRLEAKKR